MNDALRQHRRCPVNVIARIRVHEGDDLEARCATDLSLGGLKMVLDHELKPGHRVELEFRPLQSRGRIGSIAAVRWCRPLGEHFMAGLEFVEMDEESRNRFEEALDVLEDRSRNGPVRCLAEAVIETQSVEAFASSYGSDLAEARLTVNTDEPFDPGDQLLVVVDTGDSEPAFRADSVVCSCERADGGFSVGVRFWYLDETSRRFVEQVDAALEPGPRSGRWRGVDEEAWFEEGERLSGLHRLEIPHAVVRRWPLPQGLGIGVAGIGGLATAALAVFLVFRGPAVEGLTTTQKGNPAPEAEALIAPIPVQATPAPRTPDTAPSRVAAGKAGIAEDGQVQVGLVQVGPVQIGPVSSGGRLLSVRAVPGRSGAVEIMADVDLTGRYLTRRLENPPRFVVDIPGIKRSKTLRSRGGVGRHIKRFRVGRHPDAVRVVLDLASTGGLDVIPEGRRLLVTMR